MATFEDFKAVFMAFWNNDRKAIREINRRALSDRDIYTGRPNFELYTKEKIENLEKRFPNVERIQTSPIENRSTILYKIEELEYKLKNDSISEKERSILKKHLNLLYEQYEELLDKERDESYYSSIDNSR